MKPEQIKIKELSDTSHTIVEKLFEGYEYPWGVLDGINGSTGSLDASLPKNKYRKIGRDIRAHKIAQMTPTTAMGGPTIIRPKVQVHNSAFLGGSIISEQYVIIGSSREIKSSVIFDGAQVPHFNHVGDSILDYKTYMGAGAVTSNVKADKGLVEVHAEDRDVEIGREELGTILGNCAEIGCNNALDPETVTGCNSNAYPLSSIRGCVPSGPIYRSQDNIVVKEAREVEAEWEAPEAPERGKNGSKAVK